MLKNNTFLCLSLFILPLLSVFLFDSMLYLWVMMEIQTLLFILYLWSNVSTKKSIINFLVVQMYSSMVLFSVISFLLLFKDSSLLDYLFMVMLLAKVGMLPFHGWALNFVNSLDLFCFFIFISFMKLIPFFMMKFMMSSTSALLFLLNMYISVLYIFSVNSFKEVMFFSSLFLGGVLLFLAVGWDFHSFILFFLIYSLAVFLMIHDSILSFSGFIFGTSKEVMNLSSMLSVLAMLGMPFSLGFVLKLIFLQSSFAFEGYIIVIFLLSLGSMILAYHYMKILYFYFMNTGALGYYTMKLKMNLEMKKMLVHLLVPFMLLLFCVSGFSFVFYLN